MKRGWFKESYRHGLSARGISTSRYNSRKSSSRRRMFTQNPEDLLKKFKLSDATPQDRARAEQLENEIEKLKERRSFLQLERTGLPSENVSPEEFEQIANERAQGEQAKEELRKLRNTQKMLRARKKAFEDNLFDTEEKLNAARDAGDEDAVKRLEDRLAKDQADFPSDIAKVQSELEVVEDKLELFKEAGDFDAAQEFKEQSRPVKQELSEVKKELSEKMDELDEITGVGRRRTVQRGEESAVLPREKLLRDERKKFLKRLENLQKLDDARQKQELKSFNEQLDSARKSLREMRDAEKISAKDFRQASNDLDTRQQLMKTAIEFQDPKEMRREMLGTLPRRTTKRDREIITKPTKVNIAERAAKQKEDKRESTLRTKKVQRQAETAKRDTEGQLEDK